jgi:hypothetical protein
MNVKLILLGLIISLPCGNAKEPAKPEGVPQLVGMVELLASPERFNGKFVTVVGYLVIGNRGVNANSVLCLHREDSENVLSNCVGVVPSQSMHRNWRELSEMYVQITGRVVTGSPAAPEGRWIGVQDVKECTVWSDPKHPRALNPTPYLLKHRPDSPHD